MTRPDLKLVHDRDGFPIERLAAEYWRAASSLRGPRDEFVSPDAATRHEAVTILRSLIDKIVLHPGEKRGELHIELHGELAAILRFGHREQTGDQGPPVVRTVVVAGVGFEPTTFRL